MRASNPTGPEDKLGIDLLASSGNSADSSWPRMENFLAPRNSYPRIIACGSGCRA
jgi:hypothetical protein